MAPTRIVRNRTPDAVDPPRDRRPPRSRSAGPRAGLSLLVLDGVAVGARSEVGAGGGGGTGAALDATGALVPASSMGGPCAAAGRLVPRTSNMQSTNSPRDTR